MLTPEAKQARKLGGSMVAAAIGLSRYKTPLDAYLDVLKLAPEVEENAAQERGSFLEPAIRQWSAHRLGTVWLVPDLPLVHPEQPWFTFSPDGLNPEQVLEVKSPGPMTVNEWGEEGTDDVPQEYLLQGAWGLAVTGRQEAVFAALIGGELKIYRHVRDLKLERAVLDKAQAFITEHVEPRIPPPAQYGDNLSKIYKRHSDALPYLAWNDLNSVQQQLVADFLRVYSVRMIAKKEAETRAIFVQDIIREAPGIKGLPPEFEFERIDWKTKAPAMHAGTWKALAEELLAPKSTQEKEQLISAHTPTEGVRAFTPIKRKKTP